VRTCLGLRGLAVILFLFPGLAARLGTAAEGAPAPSIKVVNLEPGDSPYLVLLDGPPETASLRSGLVTLAPGASVGKHNTENYEEVLVPLEGEGELRIPGQPPVRIRPGLITYAPAHTEHDVANTGTGRLRYIFVVARVE
jgi:mannose-6-phosphate isomerase-like protein (cupin superfamily)